MTAPTARHDDRVRVQAVLAYHERTKHQPFRYAASLGYMDWATQPDPFRRYEGAPLLPLDLLEPSGEPRYEAAFQPASVPAAPLDRTAISRLFHDALAISAWKQAGGVRWALRVNPSSGNLHPTEGYLVAGPVDGLHAGPAVFHYAPLEHGLELRAELPARAWGELARQLPARAILVGLTSIYWRESWKYGERAFRYCHHDVGHAIGSLACAAAALGWSAALMESVPDEDLQLLLGIAPQTGIEAEHPDCLLALFPATADAPAENWPAVALAGGVREALLRARWLGEPNRLSRDHHHWPAIDDVASATERRAPPETSVWRPRRAPSAADEAVSRAAEGGPPLRAIIHQRRSALAFDGQTALPVEAFYAMLQRVLPAAAPFAVLPWAPAIDLLLFVHRVDGLAPGLYALVREPDRFGMLKDLMRRPHAWQRPADCPASLPLFLLEAGDAGLAARQTSCDQEIAAEGMFAVAMLADVRSPLESVGAWTYPRLFWEAGLIGQVLYLEAEARGARGTGIGCYFDDLTHRLFGIDGNRSQVLYHFTVGAPVDDPRLQTLAPYHHRGR